MTSREIVINTLEFKNGSHRTARDMGLLPWARNNYPEDLEKLLIDFPMDLGGIPIRLKETSKVEKGDMCEPGEATDAWGCTFINAQRGIIGEVKEPLVKDDEWQDVKKVHIPEEWLSFDIDDINSELSKTDKFVCLGFARPFEQLQFIRGTENFYIDLMMRPPKMLEFMEKMHDFYCRHLTKLAKTNCDGLFFMDDLGSQNSLLINPEVWRELFKPMYKDYIAIAKKHGKKTFMHSDGYILDIIPDLIDMGLDALNSQIFCMGTEKLKQFKGKITFWGEIDRQRLLPYGSINDIRKAVNEIKNNLYKNGGCIAQCEFGIGAKPENVREVFAEWDRLTMK